jgi:nitrogen regulatory protein PII
MKEIKAYIKTHKLDAVVLALFHIKDLPGFSIVDVRGCGQQHMDERKHKMMEALVKHSKIEIVCMDDQVEEIISVIEKNAHTGLRGDGKIYVSTIEHAVSIQTGERGENII